MPSLDRVLTRFEGVLFEEDIETIRQRASELGSVEEAVHDLIGQLYDERDDLIAHILERKQGEGGNRAEPESLLTKPEATLKTLPD